MRRLTLCMLLAIWSAPIFADNKIDVPADQSPKHTLFRHLAEDVMLPLTDEFAAASGRLADASRSYCARKSTLPHLQTAWRETHAAWQPLEMLQIGPVIERRTQRRVNAWPVRPQLLERLFADGNPIEPEKVESLGAAGKGLPALEYLLFAHGKGTGSKKMPLAAVHCNALQALALDVRTEAKELATDWREPNGGFARQLIEAGRHPQDGIFTTDEQALSDIVNLLIAGIDAVKIRKVGKPLEKSSDGAALERIESWRSGTSLDHIRDNLRGFELVFFGTGKSGIGLDDYLLQIERPILVRNVREALDASKQALAAVRPPLQEAVVEHRTQVASLHKALGRLQYLLETQLAEALKVDPGFNANDGD